MFSKSSVTALLRGINHKDSHLKLIMLFLIVIVFEKMWLNPAFSGESTLTLPLLGFFSCPGLGIGIVLLQLCSSILE